MLLPFKPLLLGIVSCFLFSTLLIPFVFATETANPASLDRYQQALNVDPDNPTLHYILGLAQLKSGKAENAIQSLRTAYPADTRSIEMQLNLAEAFLQTIDAKEVARFNLRCHLCPGCRQKHYRPT
jgi:predicted Zn-dependent protease